MTERDLARAFLSIFRSQSPMLSRADLSANSGSNPAFRARSMRLQKRGQGPSRKSRWEEGKPCKTAYNISMVSMAALSGETGVSCENGANVKGLDGKGRAGERSASMRNCNFS